jgi:hypothetical protein
VIDGDDVAVALGKALRADRVAVVHPGAAS